MGAVRLTTRRVEKVWGRRDLAPWFPDVAEGGAPVGEIWFEAAGDPALLVKYLFTAERLSVQVHPNDAAARAAGLPRGKDEVWVILDAGADSTIALGPRHTVTADALRSAALDGSIEALLDWRPMAAGDAVYSPSGTVHAIGAGLTLIEVQQNSDTTYRLYDYGRPREIHLEAGIAVSDLEPFPPVPAPRAAVAGRRVLAEGPRLVVERWDADAAPAALAREAWVTVVAGSAGFAGGGAGRAGECWRVDPGTAIAAGPGADLVVGWAV